MTNQNQNSDSRMNWCAVYVSGDCSEMVQLDGYPATYDTKTNMTKIELAASSPLAAKVYVKMFIGLDALFAEVIEWPITM